MAAKPPKISYLPQDPRKYRPAIGLIGCGGITNHHLEAYRSAGYRVVALCDIDPNKAERQREAFYPQAAVDADYRDLLARDEIEVVDIATHPAQRPPLIDAALCAGKHVLSQKPFVLDLDDGQRLVELAEQQSLCLAVNQNGRWAPHFSYIRQAVSAGLLGDVLGVHMSVHWDHRWVEGTEFEKIKHLILYDYAIHWFDMVCCLLHPRTPLRVYASATQTPTQTLMPPLLGQAVVEFQGAQASLAFDAATSFGSQDRTYVAGSLGSISSSGPGNKVQQLTLTTATESYSPDLQGSWFPDGFHGTMGELLCSIEERRQPTINAAHNLASLALCFAAVQSSEIHQSVVPGTVRRLPGS